MGLYIKGLKMPKDDVHAFKQITITNNWIDGEVIMLAHDSITNEFIGEVVEVPDPHGDLVDRKEVARIVVDLANGRTYFTSKNLSIALTAATVIEAEGE